MRIQNIAFCNSPLHTKKFSSKNTAVSYKNPEYNFKGADALSAYNNAAVNIQRDKKYRCSDAQLSDAIKGLTAYVNNNIRYRGKEEETLDEIIKKEGALETLSFFASALKSDPKNADDMNLLIQMQYSLVCQDLKEKERITNSDFLHLLLGIINTQNDSSFNKINKFKLYFSSLLNKESRETLDKLDALARNEITRKFIEKDIEKLFSPKNPYADFYDTYPQLLTELAKPVYSFSKEENSKIFYGLFDGRTQKDIEAISILLSKHLNGLSKEEAKELYKTIKPLLEAKTPKGDFVFTHSKQSDTGQKTSFDGIENLLDAKSNNPEKYEKLLFYLELIKSGRLPVYILGTFPQNGDTTSLADYEIIKNILEENQIKEYASKKRAFQKAHAGDTVKVKDKLYYRSTMGLSPLKIDEKVFNLLFGGVENLAFSQGANGNCYFVSAIYDFMKNPDTRGLIYQMFEQDKDNIIITLPGFEGFSITYDINNLPDANVDGDKNINAALGIKLLEDAYFKTRQNIYGHEGDIKILSNGQQGMVYNAFIRHNQAKQYIQADTASKSKALLDTLSIMMAAQSFKRSCKKENETLEKEIAELRRELDTVDEKSPVYSIKKPVLQAKRRCLKDKEENFLLNTKFINEQLPEYIFVTKGELSKLVSKQSKDPKTILSAGTNGKEKEVIDKGRMIYPNHAYSIGKVDRENQTIELINPWNTAASVVVSFEEFDKYFDCLNVCRINTF